MAILIVLDPLIDSIRLLERISFKASRRLNLVLSSAWEGIRLPDTTLFTGFMNLERKKKDEQASDLAKVDWDHYREVLTRAIRKTCPVWLRGQHEDLVQSSLIRVMEIVGNGDPPPELTDSYLWRVAHSVTIDEIRRYKRRQETALDVEEGTIEPASGLPGPDRHHLGREILRAIRECLDRLVKSRRVAVVLYALGHRAPQIARQMRWDAKRVKNLLHRGRADMRSCLTSKGFNREGSP